MFPHSDTFCSTLCLPLYHQTIKLDVMREDRDLQFLASYRSEDLKTEFRCQLVIATHSPFLLSLPRAKVYDLDAEPIQASEWYKLKNMSSYFELFERNRALFEELYNV